MDIQRKCFEESNNVNPDWSFKFDEELQQYIALDSEMELQVDEFNELWDAFRAGWQAAKAQAVQEWVNVDDRLPPVDETVLVCWDYAPDIEPEKEYTTIDENLDEYWPNCQDEPPTHWMPLPKVVKAQEPAND